MFSQVVDIASKFQLQSTLNAQEITIIQAKKSQTSFVSISSNCSFNGNCGIDITIDNFYQFKTEVQQIYSNQHINVSPFNLKRFLRIGDQFPSKLNARKLNGQGQADFSAKIGEITLFVIWRRQKPKFLSIIHEIFQKNEIKWNGKVRIITLCITKDLQGLRDYIKEQDFSKMQHFYLNQSQESTFVSQYGCFDTPYACLIDTQGKVNFSGKNDRIDFLLQDRINQLGGFSAPPIKKEAQKLQQPSEQTYQKVKLLLQKQQFQKWTQQCSRINLWLKTIRQISMGKISLKCRLQVVVYEKDKSILDILKEKIGTLTGIDYQQKIITQSIVPQSQQCSQCLKQLGQFYYWCYWNGPSSLKCRQCVQSIDENGYYKFCQNSILVSKDTTKIYTKDIGNNLQPQSQQKALTPRYQCNLCAQIPRKRIGRYVALNANHHFQRQTDMIDICQECMNKHMKTQQNKEIDLNIGKSGYLRILYQVKNYFQY